MLLKLDMIQTCALAVVILLVGQVIVRKLSFLEKYCIPAPVVGGLVFALLTLLLNQTGILTFEMDVTLQNFFMVAFFTTVGFTASFRLLKKGGLQVLIFLAISIIFVLCQNAVGIGLAKVFSLNPLIGLSTGSVPLTGGFGTSGAFAPIFEKAGATGATTVAMASATFGVVVGSMMGGPLAKHLIEKHNLVSNGNASDGLKEMAMTEEAVKPLVSNDLLIGCYQILIAMGLGTIISMLLENTTGMTFPPYIGAMFAAAIMRNISDFSIGFKVREEEISMFGDICLGLYLAMSMMTIKLWQLKSLAGPLLVMLIAQAILMIIFAYFVTFNIMGRDYEAAVMCSGQCGFGMGATSNAMANMEALCAKYGPAQKAFFIIPLVGSLFIDFFNAGIVTFTMNMFTK